MINFAINLCLLTNYLQTKQTSRLEIAYAELLHPFIWNLIWDIASTWGNKTQTYMLELMVILSYQSTQTACQKDPCLSLTKSANEFHTWSNIDKLKSTHYM